jgi:hypothetical protein
MLVCIRNVPRNRSVLRRTAVLQDPLEVQMDFLVGAVWTLVGCSGGNVTDYGAEVGFWKGIL